MAAQTLVEALIRDEGLVLRMYKDSVGVSSIGVGHNLEAKPITPHAAYVILADDVADAEQAVLRALPWSRNLDGPRFEALVNLAFNLGIGGLLDFKKALAAIERADWPTMARELIDSKWYTQVGARADRIIKQFATGTRQ